MLDFLGFIVTLALMVIAVNAVITFMDVSQSAKLTLAALAGVWIGIAAAAGSAGMIAISKPFPVIGLFVAVPLVTAAIAAAWPRARAAMLSLPMPLMIGLNAGRVFAVLFLLLAAEGRLAGPFPPQNVSPHSGAGGHIGQSLAARLTAFLKCRAAVRRRSPKMRNG